MNQNVQVSSENIGKLELDLDRHTILNRFKRFTSEFQITLEQNCHRKILQNLN